MATVPVLNLDKKKVGEIELSAAVFEQPVRQDILKDAVVWQLACRRQGTHMTKTREFVRGGGKKPFKQKGTGSARQGSSRSPLMPGGATLFGPQPRDYSYVLPKKVKKLALRTALSYLFSTQKLIVVDDLVSDGKSGGLEKKLTAFGLKKAVLIDGEEKDLFRRAARNLKAFRYYSVEGLNVYDLLKYDALVLTKSSIEKIVKRCGVEN